MPLFRSIDEAITEITQRLIKLLTFESDSTPEKWVQPGYKEDIRRGDLVTFEGLGVRPARIEDRVIGVALDRNHVLVGGRMRIPMASMAYAGGTSEVYAASSAYLGAGFPGVRGGRTNFQYSQFPEHVEQKAWELLKKHMTPEQHFAFMEGSTIELENRLEDYRLLINKSGDFTVLQGPRGAAITQASGRISSYKYPLGDEIAAFLDWFNHRTKDLIANWQCGTYGIKKEGGDG